jgi:hypothetical protein
MNEQSKNNSDDDKDPYDDPQLIDDMVRDGIEKELQKPDLSSEDRTEYEQALQNLDEENPEKRPA